MSLPDPITREERYLNAIAVNDTSGLPEPITREEQYLDYIAKNGGGGGGTSNYEQLSNKPQINGVTLSGNKSADDLNLASKTAVTGKADKVSNATSGHLAGLDSNGNLTDSGVSPTEDVTVEGNPVTFDSPFEQDAKSVVVSVKPIQDLHGYDHPWPAGGGKNKADTESASKFATEASTDVITLTKSQTSLRIQINGATYSGAVIDATLPEAGTYTLDCSWVFNTSGYGCIQCFDSNDTKIFDSSAFSSNGSLNGRQITVSEAFIRIRFFGTWSDSTGDITYSNIQLEKGSSATTFAPYSNECPISGIDEVAIGVSDGESEPTTTTIPLPSTLYGGTVDVTNGDADDNNKMILLSDIEWAGANGMFYNETPVDIKHGDGRYDHCISDCYKTENKATTGQLSDGALSVDSSGFIQIKDSRYATTSALISAMGNTQLLYELATPTTLSLTPTDVELLEGTNVVSTNAEKVAVTYKAGILATLGDIDDLNDKVKTKFDKKDVAKVEGANASKAYAVNEFMLRSDGFYKVTQPIAQNASITASNTEKTTIGAVLTALLNA